MASTPKTYGKSGSKKPGSDKGLLPSKGKWNGAGPPKSHPSFTGGTRWGNVSQMNQTGRTTDKRDTLQGKGANRSSRWASDQPRSTKGPINQSTGLPWASDTLNGKGGKGTPPGHKPVTRVQPFLTPAQQAALGNFDTTFGARVGADQRRMGDATANTQQGLADAARQHTISAAQANETMAARGLFTSSIRDGDLNDIDTTLVMRNNILNTNLHRLLVDAGSDINTQLGHYIVTHNLYNQMAVGNAEAVTPNTGKPGGSGNGKVGRKKNDNPPPDLPPHPAHQSSLWFGGAPPAPHPSFTGGTRLGNVSQMNQTGYSPTPPHDTPRGPRRVPDTARGNSGAGMSPASGMGVWGQ